MTGRVIQTVDASTASDDIEAILKADGCVIIRDLIDHGVIDGLLADMAPYLAKKPKGEGNFAGFETKRLHSLFTKSDRVGDFVTNDNILSVMDLALGPYCDNYQISSNSITAIGPGESVQPLHRDDLLYPLAHPSKRNACCTAFWALTDFTAENGATRAVPGSHLWDDERKPREDETVQAVMSKGSACIFLGATYHGGGANATNNQWRIGMFSGYLLGWLRQEQNFYMAVPPEIAREMPEKLARLLGYAIHKPFLGWVQDIQDPWDVLQGYEELSKGGDDQFADGADKLGQGAEVRIVAAGPASEDSPPTVVRPSANSIREVGPSTPGQEIDAILETDGCVIIRDLLPHSLINTLLDDLKPYLDHKPTGESDFLGMKTKRLHSLFSKTSHLTDFVANDKVLAAVDSALGPYCDTYQLSSNSISAIGPDETPQSLHRGDQLYPLDRSSRRNLACTAFWALTDFTAENGATRVVPGSHLWPDDREPREDEAVQAVMPKGSVCIFLGGTYHAGSANRAPGQWRIGMFSGYILGWLRQEQNFYLGAPPDVARKLPEKLGRLLGYSLHKPFLGWVEDFQDPWDVLQGYEELSAGGKDLFADGADDPVQGATVKAI